MEVRNNKGARIEPSRTPTAISPISLLTIESKLSFSNCVYIIIFEKYPSLLVCICFYFSDIFQFENVGSELKITIFLNGETTVSFDLLNNFGALQI